MNKKFKAVVLLSGGIDSAVALAKMINRVGKDHILCLIIDYGQPQRMKELQAAMVISKYYEVSHRYLKVELPMRLNDKDAVLPGRNAVLLSLACAWAEHYGAEMVSIGVNNDDFRNYPDCRIVWIEKFVQQLVASEMKVRVIYDLIHLSKGGVIAYGAELRVPFHLTWSCYNGGNKPCGKCDACILREKAMKKLDSFLGDISDS